MKVEDEAEAEAADDLSWTMDQRNPPDETLA